MSDVERSGDSNQALPWLAPVVKSFKFGSLEVDLRDLQQSVYEVRSRVEESVQKVEDLSDQVQRIVFSGAVDAGTRTELETAMSGFFAHLRQAGLPLCSSVLEVPSEQWSPQLKAVKSGLAVYLSCSYRGSSEVAKEPVLAASGSFASTVVELTEQQRGAMAATQVREMFRKRGVVLG